MNVLILTITAGYGHHASANAISASLEAEGVNVKTIDFFKYLSKPLYTTVDKGYLLSTRYTPRPYGRVYSSLEKIKVNKRTILKHVISELVSKKFFKIFDDFSPDLIVCTHVFCAMVLNELKDMDKLDLPVIGILTDYTIHPFWDDIPLVEYIVMSSPLLNRRAIKKGIHPSRLLPFGIPIHPKFSSSLTKIDARTALGIDPDKFTILYMGGSMGFGNIISSIMELDLMDDDFQILCVCGRNEKLYHKLNNIRIVKPHKIYSFVDNVDVMMDAADCIITKPGGLTTTECMHKKLPMILTDPIPGQEVRNSEFLCNCGAAISSTKFFPIDECVHLLYRDEHRRRQLQDSIERISLPNAASDLTHFILGFNK